MMIGRSRPGESQQLMAARPTSTASDGFRPEETKDLAQELSRRKEMQKGFPDLKGDRRLQLTPIPVNSSRQLILTHSQRVTFFFAFFLRLRLRVLSSLLQALLISAESPFFVRSQ